MTKEEALDNILAELRLKSKEPGRIFYAGVLHLKFAELGISLSDQGIYEYHLKASGVLKETTNRDFIKGLKFDSFKGYVNELKSENRKQKRDDFSYWFEFLSKPVLVFITIISAIFGTYQWYNKSSNESRKESALYLSKQLESKLRDCYKEKHKVEIKANKHTK